MNAIGQKLCIFTCDCLLCCTKSSMWPIKWKQLSSTCGTCTCGTCGTVYYAVQGGSNFNLSLWMKP